VHWILVLVAVRISRGPWVGSGSAGGGQLGPQEPGGPDDVICRRRDQPSVGGDVGDPAVIPGPPSPRGAGGADKLLVERLARHDLPSAGEVT